MRALRIQHLKESFMQQAVTVEETEKERKGQEPELIVFPEEELEEDELVLAADGYPDTDDYRMD